jgi:hypothetical protein
MLMQPATDTDVLPLPEVLSSQDGSFTSRALFRSDVSCKVEFHEWRLAPQGVEPAAPHTIRARTRR